MSVSMVPLLPGDHFYVKIAQLSCLQEEFSGSPQNAGFLPHVACLWFCFCVGFFVCLFFKSQFLIVKEPLVFRGSACIIRGVEDDF